MNQPLVKRIPHEMTIHGHTRVDDYYWLNQRDNQDVIDYLKAENAYADAMMQHIGPLRKSLYDEIVGRIKQEDMSVPVMKNGYYYYVRYEEGKEYPLYCRRKDNMDNEEEVLIDGNAMSEGHAFFDIGSYVISPDNKLIAYSIDTVSRRQYHIFIKEIATGKIFEEDIADTSGNMVWANDNRTLFYSVKDESLRSCRVMRHLLDTDTSHDVEVYYEDDATYYTFVSKTKSGKYIIINSESTMSSESRLSMPTLLMLNSNCFRKGNLICCMV